jgi:hypothetical protein
MYFTMDLANRGERLAASTSAGFSLRGGQLDIHREWCGGLRPRRRRFPDARTS